MKRRHEAQTNLLLVHRARGWAHAERLLVLLGGVLAGVLEPIPAPAQNPASQEAPSLIVTTTNDLVNAFDNEISLREALAYAATLSGPRTIQFATNLTLNPAVITLRGGDLNVTSAVTISGPGASLLTVSGNNASRVFYVVSGATANLTGLTIANGSVDSAVFPAGHGGGILNEGSLTLTNCVLTGNTSGGAKLGNGGAIYHHGVSLAIHRCTLSGNRAQAGGYGAALLADSGTSSISASTFVGNTAFGNGGGIFNSGSTLTVVNSTFTDNRASHGGAVLHSLSTTTLDHCTIVNNAASISGGGIERFGYDPGCPMNLINNLIAGNTAPASGPDAFSFADLDDGAFTSRGHNLIGNGAGTRGLTHGVNGDQVGSGASPIHPLLGPLQNNGGPTLTMALLPGSPAINAGTRADGITTDQRGVARPQFSAVDIGAFEQTPADLGTTIVTAADGAIWYLGPDAVGSDWHIYRQAPGQSPITLDGQAARIGLANDGTVLVENSNGGVYARIGSTNGLGTGWQLLTSVTAGDGATWFLGPNGTASGPFIYRWAAGRPPTYSDGAATQLSVSPDGSILARNSVGILYLRAGSNAGLGSAWLLIASTRSVPTGPTRLANGRFQFSFTNISGASFTAHATTNIALPAAQWLNLGPTLETPPGSGHYRFADPQAANARQRFYRVTSP